MSATTKNLSDRLSLALDWISLSGETSRRLLELETIGLYLFLYAPVFVVVVLSFTPKSIPAFPMPGVSLKWYAKLVPPGYDEELIGALATSIKLGVSAAVGSAVVGTGAAIGMVRNDYGGWLFDNDTLNTVFIAPMMVPWIVTGIAVLSLYSLLNVSGTFLSLVVGHVLITLPFMTVVVAGQLYGFDRSLEEAARNLGAGPLRTFYEVTLPLIAPGIVAGMMFAFTISFDNFTQTFFWTSSTLNTLPIVIYSRINFGLTPVINAMGTIVVAISLTLAFLAERLSNRLL
ncbi:MAG: ABC transporter permease [Haloarculaceae archaeon]